MLTINQLRAVVALHEHGNFHRAAESISITQPALTLSIKKAEKEIGQALFDRSQRAVRTTDAGNLVVAHGRDILARFQDLGDALSEFSGLQQGEVVFGVAPFVVKSGLARVIRTFCRAYPSIRPRFNVASFDSLHQQLLADEISFYVADQTLGTEAESCDVVPLLDEEVTFFARPDHPLVQRKCVTASDMVRYPFVGVADKIPAKLRRWFLKGIRTDREREMLSRNYPFVVCDHYEASRVLLLSTDYVSGGPIDLVRKDLSRSTLGQISLSGFDSTIATGIIVRRDRTLSPAAQALSNCFVSVYESQRG